MKAFKAKAAKDPMLKAMEIEEDTRPVFEQIRSAVCPLSHLPYEEQLEKKSHDVEKILSDVRREIVEQYKFLKGLAYFWTKPQSLKSFIFAVFNCQRLG